MDQVKAVPSIPYLGVTPDGRVQNMISGKWLSVCDNGNGYKQVFVCVKNRRYMRYVHRLVAECYLPNPSNLPEVNHKDGNKANNNVANLEWCTRSENLKHAIQTGLKPPNSDKQRKASSEIGKRTIKYARVGWKAWAQTKGARNQWIKNLANADRWGTRNEPAEVKAARRREKKRLYRQEHREELSRKAHDRYMNMTAEQKAARKAKRKERETRKNDRTIVSSQSESCTS